MKDHRTIHPALGTRCLVFAITESMMRAGGKLPARRFALGFGLKCAITSILLLITTLVMLAAALGVLRTG